MRKQKKKQYKEFAELLDNKFIIPGTNISFGIDPILGLFPGVGDWIGGVVSLYFLILAAIQGGKAFVLGRMFINILMDLLIGSIPIIGEVFDVYWKANLRNAAILKDLEQNPEQTTTESRLWIWLVVIQFIALIIALLVLLTWLVAELIQLIF